MDRKLGSDLKQGDVVNTWFGEQAIVEMKAYRGPFDFICGIAKFPNRMEMSIEAGAIYEVTFTR